MLRRLLCDPEPAISPVSGSEMPAETKSENVVETTQPEIPLQPATENESRPETENPPSNSLLERLRKTGSRILESRGVQYLKGRGRPRIDGSPGKGDIVLDGGGDIAPGSIPAPTAPTHDYTRPDSIDDILFRKSIGQAFKAFLAFIRWKVKRKAAQAGIDKKFTEQALAECKPEPEVEKDFDESLSMICKKYGISSRYGPEFSFLVSCGRMTAPLFLLFQKFDEEIERKRALENKGGS